MEHSPNAAIVVLLQQLRSNLQTARTHSLRQTEILLKLAILDLQMVLHSISDEELKEFTELIELANLAQGARI